MNGMPMKLRNFDIESHVEGHSFRRLIYKNPLSKFLTAHLSIGDILSEAFSGVWMASVSTGLMFSFSDPNSSDALVFTVIIALSVNATWGLIDGWTSIFGSKVNEADDDRILRRLWSDPSDAKAKEWIDDDIATGTGRNLDQPRRQKVMGTYLEAEPQIPEDKEYRADRNDLLTILSLVIVEVLMAVLIVFPYILFPGEVYALMLSRAIAIIISGAVAYWFARRLNRRHPIIWVLIFALLMFVVMTLSWTFGW
jgi:hypothetical protein